MKIKPCLICQRIQAIQEGKNPFFIQELQTGYVVLADHQFYRGYTIFLCKEDVKELHELKADFRKKFLEEMAFVAEAVFKAFQPKKLNYEMLGNQVPHPHWHIIPRYSDDPEPLNPIWMLDEKIRNGDQVRPAPELLESLKKKLKDELEKLPLL